MKNWIAPLLLVSIVASSCKDQNLGDLLDDAATGGTDAGPSPDAPGATGGTSGGGAGGATTNPAQTTCKTDNDCTFSVHDRPVASTADCYCQACGSAVNETSAAAYQSQWQQQCMAWSTAKGCVIPPCVPPIAPVACLAQTCRETAPCAPLASTERAIKLEHVLGVGRHADGTIYVLDQAASELRVFVSEGGMLWRKRTLGTGSGNSAGEAWYVVSAEAPAFTLKVELGVVMRMGVIRGPFAGKTFTIGQEGEVLEVLEASAVSGLPVRNLPGEVAIEYDAAVQDARTILVTRPRDDWSYEDFRLFIGLDTRPLVERPVAQVIRAKDGGTTEITFELDGVQAVARFPAPSRMEAASLRLGDRTLGLQVRSPAGSFSGVSFGCLR